MTSCSTFLPATRNDTNSIDVYTRAHLHANPIVYGKTVHHRFVTLRRICSGEAEEDPYSNKTYDIFFRLFARLLSPKTFRFRFRIISSDLYEYIIFLCSPLQESRVRCLRTSDDLRERRSRIAYRYTAITG